VHDPAFVHRDRGFAQPRGDRAKGLGVVAPAAASCVGEAIGQSNVLAVKR
jgi:hypothetical protein